MLRSEFTDSTRKGYGITTDTAVTVARMAQRVETLLVDDIDGEEAQETITFGLDGTSYEIDLTAEHAAELREAMRIYVLHGRRVGGRRKPAVAVVPTQQRRELPPSAPQSEIRSWAMSNGFEDLSERGRIPRKVREAFEAAH